MKQVERMMEQPEEHVNEFQGVEEQRELDVRHWEVMAAAAATQTSYTTRLSHP